MNRIKPYRVAAWLTCFSLVASLSTGILVGDRANAQSSPGASQVADNSARTSEPRYPTISRYATDLTKRAREGRLEPVIDHDAEINRTIEVLRRDKHNNPVLIGEGSLLTAQIAQGLALRMASEDVPESLRGTALFSLNLDALAAHAKDSSEFAARLNSVLAEVESAQGRVILFVDQLHQYVGTFATQAVTDSVRGALDSGRVRVIGATTPEAYTEYIAGDTSLSALFQQVRVGEGGNDADASTQDKNDEKSENNSAERNNGFEGDKISRNDSEREFTL